jgi:hypothetical protein
VEKGIEEETTEGEIGTGLYERNFNREAILE